MARGSLSSAWAERADTLNLFYTLEAHAKSARAHDTFLVFGGQAWTYAQAYATVLRYATWLTAKGVAKDHVVAMDLINSDVFVWLWFALWSVGAKPAFVDTSLRGEALVHTITTSKARLVLVDEAGSEKYADDVLRAHGFVRQDGPHEEDGRDVSSPARTPSTTPPLPRPSPWPSPCPPGPPGPSPSPAAIRANATPAPLPLPLQSRLHVTCLSRALQSHILALPPTRPPNTARDRQTRSTMALLLYTSGTTTTGLPKPVMVSWGKVAAATKSVSLWLRLDRQVVYTCMPLYHGAASLLAVCAVLRAAATLSLSAKFSHATFWPEIRATRATVLHYVGETCRYLLAAPASPLDQQHHVHAAFGNGLRPDVWEPFKSRFGIPHVYEIYAATEAPGALFNHAPNTFSTGAIGRNGTLSSLFLAHTRALVRVDTTASPPTPLRHPSTALCQLAAPNEPGELVYALDFANMTHDFHGYLGNDANSKIIRNVRAKGDAYFRSGDLVRCDPAGRWYFVDRLGDTIHWKAENVSTAEVSAAVGRHDQVIEASVYGVAVPGYDGRAVCAAVVFKPASPSAPSAKDSEKSGATDNPNPDDAAHPTTMNNTCDTPAPPPSPSTLRSLATHIANELPLYARPLWLRHTSHIPSTDTMKHQNTAFQRQGVDPRLVEPHGDVLYWLQDGTYERFSPADWAMVKGGGVKL